MRRFLAIAPALVVGLLLATSAAQADGATRVSDALWANGVTWDTVLTPTGFSQPPGHSVDKLYNFSMSGLTGQRAVAESAPGDHDYNGGRWWVQIVVFTEQGLLAHDPDGDGVANFELTSAADVQAHVDLGHIEIMETSIYFECPLLRSR